MKAYNIALALFIFNAVISGINSMGIFDTHVVEMAQPVNETRIAEVVSDTGTMHTYDMFVFTSKILVRMFSTFFTALVGAITVIPMLMQYGVPAQVIAMIQGPIWLVYSWGAVQFLTGRSGKNIE